MNEADDEEIDEGECSVTIVCSQLPYCDLRGDKALRAQQGGCIWCARIYVEPDGRKVVVQPGEA